jgi:hypothetical protein
MEKPPTFRKFIMNPINSTSRDRFQNLRTLLQTICLRRTKELLGLPEPTSQTRRIPFTALEQAEYNNLLHKCREEIDKAVSGRRKGWINSTVLESLLRLRLFCNNGSSNTVLQKDSKGLPVDPDELLIYLQQLDKNICTYCSGMIYSINDSVETDDGMFLRSCHHLVCRNCLPYHRAQNDGCPSCAAEDNLPLPTDVSSNGVTVQSVGASDPHWAGHYPSKLLRLLTDLRKDPTHKRYHILLGFNSRPLTIEPSASCFRPGKKPSISLATSSTYMDYGMS